jgi:hypothetical protein
MLTSDQIREACNRQSATRLHVSDIPSAKLANARSTMQIPLEEPVIALIDTTVFGSAKDGLVVCETGLYWKNIYLSPEFLTWDEFSELKFELSKGLISAKIHFTDGRILDLSGCSEIVTLVVDLLNELQRLAREHGHRPAETFAWMVAVHQEQFGPYDTESLQQLVAERRFDASSMLVWREGMPQWTAYHSVPELVPVEAQEPDPATPPPLPGAPTLADTVAAQQHIPGDSASGANEEKVDLNNTNLDELLCLPGLTLTSAKRLMQERARRSGFQAAREVGEWLELPPHQVQRLSEHVIFKPYRGTDASPTSRGRVVDF